VRRDDNVVTLNSLSCDPQVVFVDLKQLAGYTISPSFNPTRDSSFKIEPLLRQARLDMCKGLSGSVYPGKRIDLNPSNWTSFG
jgi:hypothetical protein